MTQNSRVLRFNANTDGRDFVVGDIHGAFDLVIDAMHKAAFDPAVDRLFAVGDLIDRGDGSHRCAKFLSMPYVHAVRGNHEDMLLQLHESGTPDPAIIKFLARRNGLGWWLTVSDEDRQNILAAIRKLPLAIEIATPRGPVGIIHADVPAGMAWSEFLERLEAGDTNAIETCLSGRDRVRRGNQDGVPGVGRIFAGHTIQWDGIARFGNVFSLDTGAVFGHQGTKDGGCLTMARVDMKTEPLTAPRKDVALVDLRDGGDATLRPFSAFSRPRA